MVRRRVLLVRQARADAEYWLLPGGGVQFGEDLATALRREVLEEVGLAVVVGRPLALLESISPDMESYGKHVLHVILEMNVPDERVFDGLDSLRPLEDAILSAEFFEPTALRGLELRPPAVDFIQACLRGLPPAIVYLGQRW